MGAYPYFDAQPSIGCLLTMTRKIAQSRIGRQVIVSTIGERVGAFIPPPLPPKPAIHMESLLLPLDRANRAIGRLGGMTSLLADMPLFLHMYFRKEALLSSQIEGTKSSFSDLLLHEIGESPSNPPDDTLEVANYIAAMFYALEKLRSGFPVSLRLIRESHGILLSSGRGSTKQPGEFRHSQNWIGGQRPGLADYVPPPANRVPDLMSDLERFIHDRSVNLPALVVAGLAHVQFETIHPFLDGNGRIGRLLVTLLLCSQEILEQPYLYLSLYLKANRSVYFDLLQRVRETGDWEAWLRFFLDGIAESSTQATDAAGEIFRLFNDDRTKVENLGRPAASALSVFQQFQQRPVLSVAAMSKELSIRRPTIYKSVEHLKRLGIIAEMTGRKKDRVYAYSDYLKILSRGAEPA